MEWPRLSRRRFLQVATGSAALAASGCGWLSGGDPVRPRSTGFGTLLVLDADRAQVLHAFAEALLPAVGEFPDIDQARVVPRTDEELTFVSDGVRRDFLLAMDVLQWLPPVYGRFSRFTRLTPDGRRAFLADTQGTGSDTVRSVVSGCRALVNMIYFGHPSSWKAIGYDGPFSGVEPRPSAQRRWYRERTHGGSD